MYKRVARRRKRVVEAFVATAAKVRGEDHFRPAVRVRYTDGTARPMEILEYHRHPTRILATARAQAIIEGRLAVAYWASQ